MASTLSTSSSGSKTPSAPSTPSKSFELPNKTSFWTGEVLDAASSDYRLTSDGYAFSWKELSVYFASKRRVHGVANPYTGEPVIPPFLTAFFSRGFYALIANFCLGVMPLRAMFGLSLL